VHRGVERLAGDDRREQREDVFEAPRRRSRCFLFVSAAIDIRTVEQPIAVPHLRWHRELALDDRDDARVIDAQSRGTRQHAINGAAAVIAHLEAGIVEAPDDAVARAGRGAGGQDARQAPADGEVRRRFEQGIDQHAAVGGRRPFERRACGREHLVPRQQVDDLRDMHAGQAANVTERRDHADGIR